MDLLLVLVVVPMLQTVSFWPMVLTWMMWWGWRSRRMCVTAGGHEWCDALWIDCIDWYGRTQIELFDMLWMLSQLFVFNDRIRCIIVLAETWGGPPRGRSIQCAKRDTRVNTFNNDQIVSAWVWSFRPCDNEWRDMFIGQGIALVTRISHIGSIEPAWPRDDGWRRDYQIDYQDVVTKHHSLTSRQRQTQHEQLATWWYLIKKWIISTTSHQHRIDAMLYYMIDIRPRMFL